MEVAWFARQERGGEPKTPSSRSHPAHIHFTYNEIKPGRCLCYFFLIHSYLNHRNPSLSLSCRPHCRGSGWEVPIQNFVDYQFSPAEKAKNGVSTENIHAQEWTDGMFIELEKLKKKLKSRGIPKTPSFIFLATALKKKHKKNTRTVSATDNWSYRPQQRASSSPMQLKDKQGFNNKNFFFIDFGLPDYMSE